MEQLACVKQDRELFSDIGFVLQGGQALHLTGPNGAGKTSLLRILCGLTPAARGRVCWQGQDIAKAPQAYFDNLVYIGHKAGINPQLSAEENLLYWCALTGITCSNARAIAILDTLGLVGLEDLPVNQLSAGQQRRVALARLWLSPNPLWILDEPYTSLDADVIALLAGQMAQHLANGGIVVATSHQPLMLDGSVTQLALEYRL